MGGEGPLAAAARGAGAGERRGEERGEGGERECALGERQATVARGWDAVCAQRSAAAGLHGDGAEVGGGEPERAEPEVCGAALEAHAQVGRVGAGRRCELEVAGDAERQSGHAAMVGQPVTPWVTRRRSLAVTGGSGFGGAVDVGRLDGARRVLSADGGQG